MKIAIINEWSATIGGVETYIKQVVIGLEKIGNTVALFTCRDMAFREQASIIERIQQFEPDIVYSQGLQNPVLELEVANHWPTIGFLHNYAGTCISGNKWHRFPVTSVCSQTFGVSCLFQYFPRRCGGLNPLTSLRAYRRERIRQKAFKAMRAVCVASHHMRAVMLQNGFSADKTHLLPLFPPHQNPDPEPPLARSQSGIILLAGRLTRLKGWTHLVPAMAMASKKLGRTLTLAIAGNGPDRIKLLALAEHYQVPVECYGWLSPEDITAKMRQADLLAVPSLWPEPFGLVGIEAGCVGTPAVAYAVGGISDWLIPGISGEMAPAERLHPAPLADAIFRAIGNTSHWQNLRKGAYRQSQLFSANQHIQNLIAILAGRLAQ
jgi:glycosyltransferase involved in cell wall biosynthesis